MMKNLFFVFICLISAISFAQKVKVLDQETGKGVKNVTVFNEVNTISLSTDDNGFIDISSIKENEIIFFSHLFSNLK